MEQSSKKVNVKVGLTIFSGLLIFLIFIVVIGTDDYFFNSTYNLYLYLDDTAGLVNGAPVTLGGYKIGEVEAIEFIPSGSTHSIRVKMRILKQYMNKITASSGASISSIGILGDKFVNIAVGNPHEPPVKENATLNVTTGLSLDAAANELKPGIDNLNIFLKNMRLISDSIAGGNGSLGTLVNSNKLVKDLETGISELNSILKKAGSGKGSLGKLLQDESLYTSLQNAAEELNTIARDLKSGKGTMGKLLQNDSLYNNLNSASSGLNNLVAKAGQDSTVINGLMNDKELYRELSGTIKNLNLLIKDIRENPDRYINVSVF